MTLAAFVILADLAIWIWAVRQCSIRGWNSPGCATLQMILGTFFVAAALLTTMFREAGFFALFALMGWPVLSLFAFARAVTAHQDFFWLPVTLASVAALISGLWCWRMFAFHWFALSPAVCIAVFTGIFLLVGQVKFCHALTSSVARLSPDCADAASFISALSNAGAEYQFNLHAAARKGDALYAWSFRANDFYEVPERVKQNVSAPRGAIGAYISCLDLKRQSVMNR